jgi:anti-sigma B factor antagonist
MSDAPQTSAVPIEIKGDALIARPQMKIVDDQSLKALAQAIDQKADADSGVNVVVLDLSRVQLLPSLVLGLLLQMANKCKARRQKLKLAAMQPQIRQVFSITRLDRVFDIVPSVDAALQ